MAGSIRNRHTLKQRDIRELFTRIRAQFPNLTFGEKTIVETGFLDDFQVFLVDDTIDFFSVDNTIFFTVQGIMKHHPDRYWVVVDIGAVGFIAKGADIMAPGIVDADVSIKEGDFVWVCDERHHKPLAVGRALISGEIMRTKKPGKAIKNIHYVGDRLWTLSTRQ